MIPDRFVAAEPGRLAGLDGLRAILVLMVILFHLRLFGAGWIGVSGFFVLSGFLITRILLNDLAASPGIGHFMSRFYARRALRIFPVYYAYLLLLTLAALTLPRFQSLIEQLPFAYLYVYNLYGVFGEPHHTRMLVHLWSLSVEEQFYMFWPLLIVALTVRRLRWLAVALVITGPILRMVVTLEPLAGITHASSALAVYGLTTSYLDAFALGALINLVNYRPRPWHIGLVVATAVALGTWVNGLSGAPDGFPPQFLIMGWPIYLADGYQYVWGYTLVNLFWFQVICAVLVGGRLQRFVSLRFLDYLGKRSYAMYLFHFPVIALLDPIWRNLIGLAGDHPGSLLFLPMVLAITVFMSALSFRYLEKPALNLKARFALTADRPAVPAPGGLAARKTGTQVRLA